MRYGPVSKTYTAMPANFDDFCHAEVTKGKRDYFGEYDAWEEDCGQQAWLVVVVATTSVHGKHVRNRTAFCKKHVPKRYRRWFAIDPGELTDATPALPEIPLYEG